MRVVKSLAKLNRRCTGRKSTFPKRAVAGLLGPATGGLIKCAVRTGSVWGRSSDGKVDALAKKLVFGVSGQTEQIEALCSYVNKEIQYISMDRWMTPGAVLRFGVGDCKNQAALLDRMLQTIGMETRVVVGIINKDTDNPTVHAWVDVSDDEGRFIVDPTVSDKAHSDQEYRKRMHGYVDVTPEYSKKQRLRDSKSCVGIIKTGGD